MMHPRPMIAPGDLTSLIRIQRPISDEAFDGAGSGEWGDVCEIWANVQDQLPSRSESLNDGVITSTRRTRVRAWYRNDILSAMRILVGHYEKDEGGQKVWFTDRTMQIVSGPAELGWKIGIELMAEEYQPAGNAA